MLLQPRKGKVLNNTFFTRERKNGRRINEIERNEMLENEIKMLVLGYFCAHCENHSKSVQIS